MNFEPPDPLALFSGGEFVMARSARWSITNGLYHVMNRGLEKRDIVRDDVDRHEWMRLNVFRKALLSCAIESDFPASK